MTKKSGGISSGFPRSKRSARPRQTINLKLSTAGLSRTRGKELQRGGGANKNRMKTNRRPKKKGGVKKKKAKESPLLTFEARCIDDHSENTRTTPRSSGRNQIGEGEVLVRGQAKGTFVRAGLVRINENVAKHFPHDPQARKKLKGNGKATRAQPRARSQPPRPSGGGERAPTATSHEATEN